MSEHRRTALISWYSLPRQQESPLHLQMSVSQSKPCQMWGSFLETAAAILRLITSQPRRGLRGSANPAGFRAQQISDTVHCFEQHLILSYTTISHQLTRTCLPLIFNNDRVSSSFMLKNPPFTRDKVMIGFVCEGQI